MALSSIAVRALNNYRRTSPLTYLSLRYYLGPVPSQSKRWATEIAPRILLRRNEEAYISGRHFKQTDRNGHIEHRRCFFPSANEAIAEASLLDACEKSGRPFKPHASVYSYHLSRSGGREGSYVPYFRLFAARQSAIGRACRQQPDHVVLYVDIKSYYPSIKLTHARRAWKRGCKEGGLSGEWERVGDEILRGYATIQDCLPVGPMFSHLIGNLVLDPIDRELGERFEGSYFRYVDDIAIVLPETERLATIKLIRTRLQALGLRLNPLKIGHLGAEKWISHAPHQEINYKDIDDRADSRWWMHFVDKIKCYLISRPDDNSLEAAFRNNDIRIALPNYLAAIQETDYISKYFQRRRSKSFRNMVAGLSASRIAAEAERLRELYEKDFYAAWETYATSSGTEAKWAESRVKFLLGRLMLLGKQACLTRVYGLLANKLALKQYRVAFQALVERDASEIIEYGGTTLFAAGQAMEALGKQVRCVPRRWSEVAIEGYLNLTLLGVKLYPRAPKHVRQRHAFHLISGNSKLVNWQTYSTPFFRELACLAGDTSLAQHRRNLTSPIDPDEGWALFADNQFALYS